MTALRLILADQLSNDIATLRDLEHGDSVLMCEVMEEANYVPHHPKKIAFLFAAMRHFAQDLREMGATVRYVKLDDVNNTGSLDTEVKRAVIECTPETLIITEPGEWRVLEKIRRWQREINIAVEIRNDDRFLCSTDRFNHWAGNRKHLRMEYFYRDMRRSYRILMEEDGTPAGGKWNYDAFNRNPPKRGLHSPKRLSHRKSAITLQVLQLVKERFGDHYGELEPFHFAVTPSTGVRRSAAFHGETASFVRGISGYHGCGRSVSLPFAAFELFECWSPATVGALPDGRGRVP